MNYLGRWRSCAAPCGPSKGRLAFGLLVGIVCGIIASTLEDDIHNELVKRALAPTIASFATLIISHGLLSDRN